MRNLPRARVNTAPAFSQCGVDYAGPFTLKVVKGRNHQHFKGYLALFISVTFRAVYLELVSELTTAAFISALTRFASRRGKPQVIHSDNGTNFTGANRELRGFLQSVRAIAASESVTRHISNEGINWVFIPPGAPHFGGLWEAGVKSVKYHLKRVIGNVVLDFEQMYTVLTKIEACLNSRPLCPMSSDPGDLTALTPAHFLIGEPISGIPDEDLQEVPMNRLSKWQMTQRISQHFWRRWSSEYRSRLQQRPKWWAAQPNLKTGDLVLIKEDQKTPLLWRLARVDNVHPGEDGLVRVVTVRTSDGLFKRAVNKLCPLPIDNTNDDVSVESDKSE
ncbi:unnamed protein product [Allacma fusca]|uniref:Integrase catalytic domain-containing protein n=1 Tax=Allacma fusca TaxID=39272 RepID=A0A8J2JNT1_9HEXA|nr:unnamed protein product [Allacma fusca]